MPCTRRSRWSCQATVRLHHDVLSSSPPTPSGEPGEMPPTRIKLRNEQGRFFGIIRV